MSFRKIDFIFIIGISIFLSSVLISSSFSWILNILGLTIIIYGSELSLRKKLNSKFFFYLFSFFTVWFSFSTYYLFETLYFNANLDFSLSFLLVGIANVLMLLPYFFMVSLIYYLRDSPAYIRMAALLTLWLAIELFTQNFNYSLSTLKLSFFHIDSPLNVYFSIGGSLLVSAFVIFIAILLSKFNRYTALALFVIFFISTIIGAFSFSEKTNTPPLTIAIVQTGESVKSIKERDIDFPNNIFKLLDGIPTNVDLIILPEVISNHIVYNFPKSFFTRLRQWAKERQTDLIFGAFNNSDNQTGIPIVSAFYVRSEEMREYLENTPLWGLSNNYYGKQALIPFAETSPGILKYFDNSFDNSNLSKSHFKDTVWEVKGYLISPSICYDFYFPQIANKNGINVNLLLNIGSQSWLTDTRGPEVLHNLSRVRAMENASPVLRVDTYGISEFINEKGNVIFQLPQGKSIVRTFQLYNIQSSTPYAKYSDYPLVMLLLLNILLIILYYRTRFPKLYFNQRV